MMFLLIFTEDYTLLTSLFVASQLDEKREEHALSILKGIKDILIPFLDQSIPRIAAFRSAEPSNIAEYLLFVAFTKRDMRTVNYLVECGVNFFESNSRFLLC